MGDIYVLFNIAALVSQRGVFIFDRYFELSPKANARYQRQGKEGSSRTYVLKPDITPPRTCILGVTECKKQLNVLLSDALLDPEFTSKQQVEVKLLLLQV